MKLENWFFAANKTQNAANDGGAASLVVAELSDDELNQVGGGWDSVPSQAGGLL